MFSRTAGARCVRSGPLLEILHMGPKRFPISNVSEIWPKLRIFHFISAHCGHAARANSGQSTYFHTGAKAAILVYHPLPYYEEALNALGHHDNYFIDELWHTRITMNNMILFRKFYKIKIFIFLLKIGFTFKKCFCGFSRQLRSYER